MSFFLNKIWNKGHFEALTRFLIKRATLLFVIAFVFSVVSLYGALHLRIDSDYMAFLPDDFPGVKNLKEVIEKTGGFGNFMIVLEGGDKEKRRDYARLIAKDAEKFDWVDYAEYKKDWEKIEKNKLLYLQIEDIKTILKRLKFTISYRKNPLLVSLFGGEEEGDDPGFDFSDIERKYQRTSFGSSYFEDQREKYTIVVVWPKGAMTNIYFADKAYGDLNSLIGKHNPTKYDSKLTATIGGEFRNKVDEYHSLRKDVLGSASIAFFGICFLLFIFFRNKRALFVILIPLSLAVLWSSGLASILVGRLNLLTVFLIAILFGLGVDYGIYLFSRYVEERSSGKSLEETITTVLYDTGRATIGAAITTAMAFATLIFMDFKGFQEFGILASTGIGVLLITFFIYGPVFWILGERWGFFAIETLKKPIPWVKRFSHFKGFVWGGICLAFLGLLSLPFLSFEHDYGKLRSKRSTYMKVSSIIHEVFPLSKTPAVVITDSIEETRVVVEEVRKRIPKVETIDTVKSIIDFLPDKIEEKKKLLTKIKKILVENGDYMNEEEKKIAAEYLPYLTPDTIKLEDLPRGLSRYFTGLPGAPGYLVFIYDKVRLSDAREAKQYSEDIREFKTDKKTYYPAEGSLVFADAVTLMKKEAYIAFCVMLLGVLAFLGWHFRSFKMAFVIFIPLSMTLLITFGVMFVAGIRLNMFNLVVFPLLIGIGIDGFIHLYHRFLEEREGEGVDRMITSTGSSLLLATLTTMIAFGSILLADQQGLRSIGIVAVTGMASQLIVSLLFFPAFLAWRFKETT